MKTVLIHKMLVAELESDRAKYLPNETGGYLLGQRRGGYINIVSATRQGIDDKATPWSFDRDDDSHYRVALDRWKKDAGRTGYAGDWHSHPAGDGSPSGKDRKAWSILCDHSKGPVVGLILGETKRLRVFRCTKVLGILRVIECVLVGDDETELIYASGGAEGPQRPA